MYSRPGFFLVVMGAFFVFSTGVRADDKEIDKLKRENEELRKLLVKEQEAAREEALKARKLLEVQQQLLEKQEAAARKAAGSIKDEQKELQLKLEDEMARSAMLKKRMEIVVALEKARADELLAVRKMLDETRKDQFKLMDQLSGLKEKVVNAEAEALLFKKRNAALEERIKELEKRSNPVKIERSVKVEPPAAPANLKGEVNEVNAGLAVISLGSDDGLVEGQTLEVARVDRADPKKSLYLGTVKVVNVSAKKSVCRFQSTTKQGMLKAGDVVFTKLESK